MVKTLQQNRPDVIGTPSADPLSSESDAVQHGFAMVNDQYQLERAGLAPKNPFPGNPIIVGDRVIFAAYDANW